MPESVLRERTFSELLQGVAKASVCEKERQREIDRGSSVREKRAGEQERERAREQGKARESAFVLLLVEKLLKLKFLCYFLEFPVV